MKSMQCSVAAVAAAAALLKIWMARKQTQHQVEMRGFFEIFLINKVPLETIIIHFTEALTYVQSSTPDKVI